MTEVITTNYYLAGGICIACAFAIFWASRELLSGYDWGKGVK